MIRHLKGELGSSSPLSGPYYQAWSSENQTQFMSSQSSLNKQFGRNSTVQGFVIPIRAFSSTAAPTPTPTPTPKPTSVAEVKKTSASSKIVFNRSSSILTKSSKAKLKKLAKTVGAGSKITVTASVGPLNGATKAQMTALAKLRAEAISKYLKSIIGINHTFKVNIIDSGVKPVTTVKAN
jgi:outer membrane protein OmpA-like peptidoglycan-associated protein